MTNVWLTNGLLGLETQLGVTFLEHIVEYARLVEVSEVVHTTREQILKPFTIGDSQDQGHASGLVVLASQFNHIFQSEKKYQKVNRPLQVQASISPVLHR